MKALRQPMVDRQKKTITVTRAFLVLAGQFDTSEFRILQEMKQNHPDYSVEVYKISRNPDKQVYGDLTYEHMREFILGRENGDAQAATLEEFQAIQNISRTMRGSYAFVKKWFLSKYGEEFKTYQKEQAAMKRAASEAYFLDS